MKRIICLALLLLSPLAAAGTADDPEVTDPADDQELAGGGEDVQGIVKSVDVVAAWIEVLDEGHLQFWIQASKELRGGSVEGNPTTEYEYDFHFEVGEEAYVASVHVVGNPPTVTPGGVATEAARGDDVTTAHMTVPLDAIGAEPGATLTGLYVASRVYTGDSDLGTDRAPDEGSGRDYTVPQGGPEAFYFDLEGDAAEATIEGPTPEAVYIWNWTAPAGSFNISVQAPITVNESITPVEGAFVIAFIDPDGKTVYECDCDGRRATSDAVEAGNGTWRIIAAVKEDQAGFAWSIDAADVPQAPDDDDAGNGTVDPGDDMDGNGTAPDGEESPAPGAALLVVGVAAMALLRRRR